MINEKKEKKKKILNYTLGNIIYIHGVFDDSISEYVLHSLDSIIKEQIKKKKGKIIFDINSNGGYTRYLRGLLSRIEYCKKQGIIVETRVSSHAYSCGSILACSGTIGYRYVSEFAEHLCHLGSSSTGHVINDIELERMSERVKAHFDFVRDTYKKYAKIPDLKNVIHDDCLFVRGQKILDWKLADKFLSDRTEND